MLCKDSATMTSCLILNIVSTVFCVSVSKSVNACTISGSDAQ